MLDLTIKGGRVVDGTGAPERIADVGVSDGRIVEVGRVTTPAKREIAADGLLVTPGWIDLHTHYDGQATWDPQLDPSFSSGVTTAIVGNCGVGFAPITRGMETRLIELMEGVEEIPGTALHEGLRWNWSSFPDYLDVLDAMPHSFDIGALLPHGPLRLWAMGNKVGTDKCASGDELKAMADATDAAMRAGAFGLATSRTRLHRTLQGEMTPDYQVDAPELKALASVVARHGGIFEVAPDGLSGESLEGLQHEMKLYDEIIGETGVNFHFLLFQAENYPHYFAEQVAALHRWNGGKARVNAQLSGRCSGVLMSFLGSHPFLDRPTMLEIQKLPVDRWLGELAKPDVKARLLTEKSRAGSFGEFLNQFWHRIYDLGADRDYEPDASRSVMAMAEASGRTAADVAYDLLLSHSHQPRLYGATTNYPTGSLDLVREAHFDPAVVLGVSDAGAHVLTVCDGSVHSFMLTHWTRDRKRGPKLSIEQVVHIMTQKCAQSIGLNDRGVIAPGMKADLNVVDHDALTLQPPQFFSDLPTGARRVMQKVTGYRATIVAGVPTRENDVATGELPGRLARFRRTAA